MKRFLRWFRLPARTPRDVTDQLDDEIRFHLDARAAQLRSRGMDDRAARLEAIRRFGPIEEARHSLGVAALQRERRMRIREMAESWRQDTAYALRSVGRERALSLVIIATLALGIGANATMFGLLDRLLLRGPEYVREPDRLQRFYVMFDVPAFGMRTVSSLGYVAYTAFRDDTRSFEGVAAYSSSDGTIGSGEDAERVRVGAATWDFFDLLGVTPRLGRFYTQAEDTPPGGENVVVIGEGLWHRRFGSDPAVLGRSLIVGDESFTIIGVAPTGFTGVGLERVDTWQPMTSRSRGITSNWPTSWNAQWLQIVGRLRPGVEPAEAGLDGTRAFRNAYTGDEQNLAEARVSLAPLRYNRQGREPIEFMISRWLVAVASIVLLIACANVMNLFLARASRRRRETAVRLAMGISRGRLIRLHLLHGGVLAIAGGCVAVLLARIAGPLARNVLLPTVEWAGSPMNGRVMLFTGLVAGLAGILTSLVPALRASRQELTSELKAGVREGGGRTQRLRTVLTLSQVTLSVVLLVAAGLFSRSLASARAIDLGIEPDRVLAVSFQWPSIRAVPGTQPDPDALRERMRRRAFALDVLERARSLPGVSSASVAVGTPFQSSFTVEVRATGWDSIPELAGGGPYVSAVTGGFFETVGLEILEGRPFTTADRAGSEPVTVVSRTMANTLWPGQQAIGNCIYSGDDQSAAPCSRIVGVVEDAHRFGLREQPAMHYYIPRGQEVGFGGDVLLVRPRSMDDVALVDALRALAIDIDPGLSYVRITSLQDEVDPQIRPWKLGATLFGIFGGLALLIAAIGLYSVIAYGVASRTHELGVRMALGALSSDVVAMVLRQAAALSAVGLALGGLIALLAGRFIQPALFDVSPRDPFVFTTVGITMFAVALLAGFVPAIRASRVDPVITLRSD